MEVFDGTTIDPQFAIALQIFLAEHLPTTFPNLTISGTLNVQETYQFNGISGYTGTVQLAKLTGGGSNGSLTVQKGLITSYTAPT